MKNINQNEIVLGVCYYPEHWPKSEWRSDLERMRRSGLKIVRIGEFSWNLTEPEDGRFDYDFYDAFLDLTDEMDMGVIFGTPTATPPAWLTEKYPETLNCDKYRRPYIHGGRRHYNYNSEVYIRYVKRIVKNIALHYGPRRSVIGWQIDNEINCELSEFYSEADEQAFRQYLMDKYKSLEALNQAWGTVFWNQTYTSWEQVHLPANVPNGSGNPHQALDFKRFISFSARKFVKMQSDLLKKYIKPSDFITTNGMFKNLDNHKMAEESLDFYCYDSYPNFAFELCEDPLNNRTLNDRKWSKYLSEVRSVSPNFGIMEQQTGANGWTSRMEAPAPKPGQIKLWTMQSIAHGADFISFFRWRTCTFGTEMYWHGILDYSGQNNRRLKEIQSIYDVTRRLGGIVGTKYEAAFAVIADYDNLWDADVDKWHGRCEAESYKGLFTAAQRLHIPMDYLYINETTLAEALLKYPVLFYPHAVILDEHKAALLEAYVQNGGTLVLGARCGQKNTDGHCVMTALPGQICSAAGTEVSEYTLVGPGDAPVYIEWDDVKIPAMIFNDVLKPHIGTEVLGIYTSGYYKGEAGLTCRSLGQGRIFYFGSVFSQEASALLLKKLGMAEPYGALFEIPECCEIAVRKNHKKRFYFILNYSDEEVFLNIRRPMRSAVGEDMISGRQALHAYGSILLEEYIK